MSMRARTGAPIRVLFVIGTLDIGGTELQLVGLATRLGRVRFTARVCCLEHEGPLARDLREAGVPVDEVPFRGLSVLRSPMAVLRRFGELVALMRKVQPTIVQTFLPHANTVRALAARLARVPIVLTGLRGLDGTLAVGGRLAARLADAVLANAEAVRDHAVRGQGMPAAKLRVIRNGLDLDTFQEAARPPAPDLPSGRLVVTVANPNRFKTPGLLILVESATSVLTEIPAARFVLVGDGPCRPAVLEAVRARGLADRFICLGARTDVPAILACCEVMVLPSLQEGLPNAVLEAMAAGKAVVASRVGGIPELVLDGETGLLVPAGDSAALASAISSLLADPARAARMGQAGRARVQALFSLDRMIRETEALYDELLDRKGLTDGV